MNGTIVFIHCIQIEEGRVVKYFLEYLLFYIEIARDNIRHRESKELYLNICFYQCCFLFL